MKKVRKTSPKKKKPLLQGVEALELPIVPAPEIKIDSGSNRPFFLGLLLPVAWVAFSLVMLTFPNSNWLYPQSQGWFFHESYWYVLFAFIAMVAAFKLTPPAPAMEDLPPSLSWILLPAILGLAAYLRLYHASIPMMSYWDDPARDITWPRQLFELGDYSDGFVFEPGHTTGEPLFFYFTLFLWHLVPNLKSIYAQRLATTLVDLGTIFVLYHLGKEIANRRVGLLLALIGALSKAMVVKCIDGLRVISMPFAMALALLAFFRLLNKPTLSRFLQWGAAVALGTYTYSSYRPLAPFFLTAGLVWTLSQSEENVDRGKIRTLVLAVFAVIVLYFWYTVTTGNGDNWVSRVVNVSDSFFPCMVAALFLLLFLFYFKRMGPKEKESRLTGWILGTVFCVVLSFPIMTQHDMLEKVRDNLKYDQSGWALLSFGLDRIKDLGINLFWANMDNAQPDFGLSSDSLFGYSEIILIALGLAFVLGRFDWKKGFLLGAALVAVSNIFMPSYFYSAREMACVGPLFALAALGLDEFLRRVLANKGAGLKWFAGLLLVVFSFWTAHGVISRAYAQFAEVYQIGSYFERARAYREVMKEQDLGHWVFIDHELAHCQETGAGPAVLFEGRPVPTWYDFNPIYVSPGEPLRDLVIIVAPQNPRVKAEISKAFPKIVWDEIHVEKGSDNPLAAYKCVIPASQWVKAPPTLLKLVQVPDPCWTRDYYGTMNGLGMGVIDAEDRTIHAADPVPQAADERGMNKEAVQLTATLHFAQGGRYELKADTENRLRVLVDGRRVVDLKFNRTRDFDYQPARRTKQVTLNLEAGDHKFQVVEGIQRSKTLPTLTLHRVGDTGPEKSVWDSFSF